MPLKLVKHENKGVGMKKLRMGIVGLDVHFISSLPVLQRPACMAWADTRCVQIVGAES
jgi:hypothetical protein